MNILVNYKQQTFVLTESQVRRLVYLASDQECEWYVVTEGKVCLATTPLRENQIVYVFGKLRGGKGGFGAKLKTEGGKKVRPNQNMFSKDLQGQPVEYSTINKQYEEFYKKKMQQNQKVEKELAQFQIVSNTYRENYTSNKLDNAYNAEMQENQQRLKNSMKVGMKKFLEKKREQKVQAPKQEGEQANQFFEEDVVKNGERKRQEQKLELGSKEKEEAKKEIEQERLGQPNKRVKLMVQLQQIIGAKAGVKAANKVNQVPIPLMSARDKLKSLFKK